MQEIGFSNECFDSTVLARIFDILALTIEDYTMDKRGDIGSIVREQSMITMLQILRSYSQEKDKKWIITNEHVARMIGLILQQLNEKIDRVRLLAGSILQDYFDNLSDNFEIPRREQLKSVFGQ